MSCHNFFLSHNWIWICVHCIVFFIDNVNRAEPSGSDLLNHINWVGQGEKDYLPLFSKKRKNPQNSKNWRTNAFRQKVTRWFRWKLVEGAILPERQCVEFPKYWFCCLRPDWKIPLRLVWFQAFQSKEDKTQRLLIRNFHLAKVMNSSHN